jgi:hypothetical protein
MTQPPVLALEGLSTAPIWAIWLFVVAALAAGREVGLRLRLRFSPEAERAFGAKRISGNYLGASLGLLALLVGFSFSMAIDRYTTQRRLVGEEANSISTAHRQLETLQEPDRTRLSRALLPYVEAREAFSRAVTPDQLRAAEARTDQLQAQFWSEIVGSAGPETLTGRAVFDATDAMFNAAATRRAALEASIPRAILGALLLYSVIAAGLMGYSHPVTRRYVLASTIQFFLLSLAFGLIVDLDRPRTGLVEVSQAPMFRAAALIRAATPPPGVPPAAFHR